MVALPKKSKTMKMTRRDSYEEPFDELPLEQQQQDYLDMMLLSDR